MNTLKSSKVENLSLYSQAVLHFSPLGKMIERRSNI